MEALEAASIIRLRHCQKEIFCLSVPEACPGCGEELRASRLQEAPVSLPNPLCNGHKTSCCLLLAPAEENHSRVFDGTADLHTGISNTKGVVYNYTRVGVRREQSGWERCVSVPLVRPDTFSLLAQWDQYLDQFSDAPMWDPAWHRFDEDSNNCFSFCLAFINRVLATEGRSHVSRDQFTQSFILPRLRRVWKFSALSRRLRQQQFYMVERGGGGEEEAAPPGP
ncbi:MKRN2 opposite strand protein [Myripristis murdjan]|uniref:MKRN2 opposite strand protein n=1 Tax=Myripristis murdjan TaxID=586833 RepID=UPI001175F0F5|nr:MKRN2 opposite strand protein-like [Myripristis murdjan]